MDTTGQRARRSNDHTNLNMYTGEMTRVGQKVVNISPNEQEAAFIAHNRCREQVEENGRSGNR